MALGNIYGGKTADKNPNPDKLYSRILIAAIWIALIPAVGTSITFLIFAGILLLLAIIYFISEHLGTKRVVASVLVFVFCCVFGYSDSFAFWQSDYKGILNCRSGKDLTDYDLVEGGVANDKVFNTVELFFDGLIDKTEAINRLRYEKPNLQICFRTEKALSLLHFEGSELI